MFKTDLGRSQVNSISIYPSVRNVPTEQNEKRDAEKLFLKVRQ